MPHHNHFRHQEYDDGTPRSTYELVSTGEPLEPGCDEFQERLRVVGDRLRQAGVDLVLVVHGTFVGQDMGSVWIELGRWSPSLREVVSRRNKAWVDALLGERGNYSKRYIELFEQGLNRPGEPHIAVESFDWSGENHHFGRADGAVRLVDRLQQHGGDQRVLLWGHSHAGNVFALATNLIAATSDVRDAFFNAARVAFRSPVHRGIDVPVWQEVWDRFAGNQGPALDNRLDIVTFGTPVRYGWDAGGYRKLMHIVHHRPFPGREEYLAGFPPARAAVMEASQGDIIQQIGIAGTNVAPNILFWRTWSADRRLNRFLQPRQSLRQLKRRLEMGMRVPEEGHTLLVDYGVITGSVAEHHAGHAVYTLPQWLVFHAERVADQFYP